MKAENVNRRSDTGNGLWDSHVLNTTTCEHSRLTRISQRGVRFAFCVEKQGVTQTPAENRPTMIRGGQTFPNSCASCIALQASI